VAIDSHSLNNNTNNNNNNSSSGSSNSNNNHTTVLQNVNSGGVISSAGFHGTNESNLTLHKSQFDKQPVSSRLHALQHEESSRRSRFVDSNDGFNFNFISFS
jgi:translation initiation factor 2-alpha kinase 4